MSQKIDSKELAEFLQVKIHQDCLGLIIEEFSVEEVENLIKRFLAGERLE